MQVTASGIAYPDDSDPSDLKTLLSTMASSIEDTVGETVKDSGWVNISINSGFEGQGGIIPQVRKIGKLVLMRWGFSNKGMSTTGSFKVGSIPSGYRPAQTLYGPVTGNAAWRSGRGIVWSNGDVEVTTGSDLSTYYLFGTWNWTTD